MRARERERERERERGGEGERKEFPDSANAHGGAGKPVCVHRREDTSLDPVHFPRWRSDLTN